MTTLEPVLTVDQTRQLKLAQTPELAKLELTLAPTAAPISQPLVTPPREWTPEETEWLILSAQVRSGIILGKCRG